MSRQKITPEPRFDATTPLTLVKGDARSKVTPIDLRIMRVEEFLDAKAISDNSQKAYRQDLQTFIAWTTVSWAAVTPRQVAQYKNYLSSGEGKPRSDATIARMVGTLKNFYKWMQRSGYVTTDPTCGVEVPKLIEPEAQNLSVEEVKLILEAAAQTNLETRNLALIAVLLHGLRAGEVSALNVGDYDGKRLHIRKAKADSKGKVPLAKAGRNAVNLYLQWRKAKGDALEPNSPLFLSHSRQNSGARLSYDAIRMIVNQISDRSGVKVHAHQFRHTFATNLVMEGMNPYHVMTLTRHKSASSFRRYTKAADQAAAEAEFERFEE